MKKFENIKVKINEDSSNPTINLSFDRIENGRTENFEFFEIDIDSFNIKVFSPDYGREITKLEFDLNKQRDNQFYKRKSVATKMTMRDIEKELGRKIELVEEVNLYDDTHYKIIEHQINSRGQVVVKTFTSRYESLDDTIKGIETIKSFRLKLEITGPFYVEKVRQGKSIRSFKEEDFFDFSNPNAKRRL